MRAATFRSRKSRRFLRSVPKNPVKTAAWGVRESMLSCTTSGPAGRAMVRRSASVLSLMRDARGQRAEIARHELRRRLEVDVAHDRHLDGRRRDEPPEPRLGGIPRDGFHLLRGQGLGPRLVLGIDGARRWRWRGPASAGSSGRRSAGARRPSTATAPPARSADRSRSRYACCRPRSSSAGSPETTSDAVSPLMPLRTRTLAPVIRSRMSVLDRALVAGRSQARRAASVMPRSAAVSWIAPPARVMTTLASFLRWSM